MYHTVSYNQDVWTLPGYSNKLQTYSNKSNCMHTINEWQGTWYVYSSFGRMRPLFNILHTTHAHLTSVIFMTFTGDKNMIPPLHPFQVLSFSFLAAFHRRYFLDNRISIFMQWYQWYQNELPWPLFRGCLRSCHRLAPITSAVSTIILLAFIFTFD